MTAPAKIRLLFIGTILILLLPSLRAQSILDPSDPVRDPSSSIVQPPYGTIGKWVRTKKMSWNTESFKAYIYKGRQFRLKFPKTYNPNVNDGKKYPIYIYFHGLGEKGDIYDNEYQLYRGGLTFSNAVDNGLFDGYLLYMQSEGFFGYTEYQLIRELVDYMVVNNKLDRFRIYLNGISAGSQAVWEITETYPTYATSAGMISNVSTRYGNHSYIDSTRFTPLWLFQGGLDLVPSPYTARQVRDSFVSAGADFQYTEFATLNHICWDSAWANPQFYTFLLKAYASNPWPLHNKRSYHAGDAPIIVGLAPGFDAYEWRRNGVPMFHQNKNQINVTAGGIYEARVKKGNLWSEWSPVPVKIDGPEPSDVTSLISPNPFHTSFTISLTASQNTTYQFQLFDMNGRMVDQMQKSVTAGVNTITYQPSRVWQQGIYVLKVTSPGQQLIYKILKQ